MEEQYGNFMLCERRAKKLYQLKCKKALTEYDLTYNEISVINILSVGKYDTAKDIAECCFAAKSHISQSVDSLTKRGWIEGEADINDRRCVHLKLKKDADDVIKIINRVQNEFEAAVFKNLNASEKKTIENLTYKIIKNLEKELEKENL